MIETLLPKGRPDAKKANDNMLQTATSLNRNGATWTREEVLEDYRICVLSREASILSRKEVLSGKANFAIIGDGKELAQVAMAKAWRKGDFRAGYYRDQTLIMALGLTTLEEMFAQLYGDPNNDPFSRGRQMNCHFATAFVDEKGDFTAQKDLYNITSDIAPTAGQMARALGLAYASKKFREYPEINGELSRNGNEVCFCTIGDASTSEGPFWETVNAAGVLQVPLSISVWDDGYGISVPKKYQTTKESISEALRGMEGEPGKGWQIHTAKAWNYEELCQLYAQTTEHTRQSHQPVLLHIEEVTQQLGHSTSGDHRRYKSAERLRFEEEYDCNRRFADWIVSKGLATREELDEIKVTAKKEVLEAGHNAYNKYQNSVQAFRAEAIAHLQELRAVHPDVPQIVSMQEKLESMREVLRHEVLKVIRQVLLALSDKNSLQKEDLAAFIEAERVQGAADYGQYLYSESEKSALKIAPVAPVFSEKSQMRDGYEVLNACFDHHFTHNPRVFAFGEDVGYIGDVNQGMRGLQLKHGEGRVFDTGIREWTIMGQAIGLAMRGLRPIAEIQYLDYIYYGLAPLTDDLCTLRWRTNNLQAAPAIIRTRGHRLVGVWHAGSPMGAMLGSMRGMWLCVPRNMTQAAGMYNTLLASDDPAVVVEVLNGYRLKEQLPDNIGTFRVPLGVPDIIRRGHHATIITYGACVRIAEEAAVLLQNLGTEVEIIDVQTLLPFDLTNTCIESLKKTNRVLFFDEDVPGGASSYMMREVLEVQGGYRYLDAAPATLAAKAHRPGYGQDGDYHSKPQAEDVVEAVLALLEE
jgi:pyruvate/2-oxoglutarate/acetoin dehydrogenase E1 component/TPP-dependent pyruvate/acetoin dehydrogenase alpha subunit